MGPSSVKLCTKRGCGQQNAQELIVLIIFLDKMIRVIVRWWPNLKTAKANAEGLPAACRSEFHVRPGSTDALPVAG
jgi:hypothetical protein